MADRLTCPRCDKPARRLTAQASSPKEKGGTGRSTTVPVAAVLCATMGTKTVNGHLVGTYSVEKGQHGVVLLDEGAFAKQVDDAHRAAAASQGWGGAKKAPRKPARKPKAGKGRRPKGKASAGPATADGPATSAPAGA